MRRTWSDGRIRLTYATVDDLDDIAGMLARPEVCEHVYFGPNTEAETRAYFEPMIAAMAEALTRGEDPPLHIFTIRAAADGAFAGECALIPVLYGEGNFTIGYQLVPERWGQGFGTAACRFLIWFGFAVLGARRLSGDTLASNRGSIRIMESHGFAREGTQRGYYNARGEVRDNVLFGLLRDDVTVDLDAVGADFRLRVR